MIKETLDQIEFELETTDNVFSPSTIDVGTKAMLSFVTLKEDDKVLDLGCGCGIVGIWAAKKIGAHKVVQCDILEEAIECAKKNAQRNEVSGITVIKSDGLSEIADKDFTYILSNPPYHTDFSVAKGFIEDGFSHLLVGGHMVMVTKRLDWYRNKLASVFGGVTVREKDGYYIFIAEKRGEKRVEKKKEAPAMSKKLMRKQERKKAHHGKSR